MDVGLWAGRQLVADIKSTDVPRVGEQITIDGTTYSVSWVSWQITGGVISAKVGVVTPASSGPSLPPPSGTGPIVPI